MRIGFLRLGLPTELNLATGSVNTLGTEIREGLFKAWLSQGHEITIFGGVPEKDSRYFKQIDFFGKMSWIRKLGYKPLDYPQNIDVLFVECGVPNTLYSYEVGGKTISYIERCIDVIDNFEGKVVYYQHGILPFPFGEVYSEKGEGSSLNLRNLLDEEKLFRGKEWTILHHFRNEEKFINEMEVRKKMTYRDFEDKLSFKFIPLCYGRDDPLYEPRKNPEWDALWIGGEWDSASRTGGRRRLEEIRHYYDTKLYSSAVIGKWDDETVKKFENLKYLGQCGKHRDAYKYWNNSNCCIWTTSEQIRSWGLIPTRPIMVMRSGSLCLADPSIYGVEEVIDKDFLVSNPEEVREKLDWWKSLDLEEKKRVRDEQLSKFPRWEEMNWRKILVG